jgi:hypothetical protein
MIVEEGATVCHMQIEAETSSVEKDNILLKKRDKKLAPI